jgi:thiol-disulfide isomerase/thioredoxin
MKKSILFFALLISAFVQAQRKPAPANKSLTGTVSESSTPKKSKFTVKFKTNSFKEGIAYLCFHMGKNLNIEDSAAMRPDGTAIFKSGETSPGGIYAIVFPGKRQTFDFFISSNDSDIILSADTNTLPEYIIKGAPENTQFIDYQKYVSIKGGQLQGERQAYMASRTAEDSAMHLEKFNVYNKELNDYRDSLMKNFPNGMMTSMLYAMKDPDILIKKPITRQDTIDNYQHYKKHFWDGVTFMDDRVLRTPFFLPKLERYYRELLPPSADSIIQDIDYKLLFARNAPEMYKFLLNWYTDEYINPKFMGQDAVFVHLFEKYHSKGLTSWLNEKQMETISRRAYMQMSNLIGIKASDLDMVDSTGKRKTLYGVNAAFTLVVFWDPTCGHCKEEIPRIDSIYRASWKAKGLKVYSVLSDNDKKNEWVNFVKEKKLEDWVHVYETKEMEKIVSDAQKPSFRQLYDVIQTPTIFLLDNEKRIIGKKLGVDQLNELIKAKLNNKKD